jgi:Outer membrane protein
MNWYKKTVILVLLSGSLSAYAQKEYSLAECIDYSLSHHASVDISKNNVQIAKEGQHQAYSLYLPQASGTFNMTDNLQLQTTVVPAGILSPKEVELKFGKQYNNVVNIDLSQTIYDQAKINNIKTGRLNVEVAKIQNKQNDESIIYNTSQAYFQVLIYKEYESTLTTNIISYKKLYQILELQYKKGVALEIDLDRIKVSLKSAEYQLNETATQHRNALSNLKFRMGLPLDSTLHINDSNDFSSYASLPQIVVFDFNRLTDYSLNKLNVDLQKINMQTKKAAFLPAVNSFARFGNQSYDEAFSNSFSNWKDYSYIGVSVNIPIFSGMRRSSQVKESKLTYKNATENLELAESSCKLRFDNAEKSLLTAYNSYMSNKDNLDLAQKIYDKTNLSYQKGAASMSDFLSDDTALKNAQTNYMNSLFSYMLAKLDYEKSKGTLSIFYNQLKTTK